MQVSDHRVSSLSESGRLQKFFFFIPNWSSVPRQGVPLLWRGYWFINRRFRWPQKRKCREGFVNFFTALPFKWLKNSTLCHIWYDVGKPEKYASPRTGIHFVKILRRYAAPFTLKFLLNIRKYRWCLHADPVRHLPNTPNCNKIWTWADVFSSQNFITVFEIRQADIACIMMCPRKKELLSYNIL